MIIFLKILLITLTVLWGLYCIWVFGLGSGAIESENPPMPFEPRWIVKILMISVLFIAHLVGTMLLFNCSLSVALKIAGGVLLTIWILYTLITIMVLPPCLSLVLVGVALLLLIFIFSFAFTRKMFFALKCLFFGLLIMGIIGLVCSVIHIIMKKTKNIEKTNK